VKRSIVLATCTLIVCVLAAGSAIAEKAGAVENNVYTDSEYGFSFTVPTGWSTKIKDAKQVLRVSLMQTSAVPPSHFQGDLRDYMQIPTMAVIVDTTSEGVDKFIDNLLDNNYKSKQKKGLLKYLDLIAKPHEVLKRKDVTFQDQKATIVEVRQAYSMEVSERGSDRASVVNDFKTGSMFFTVRGGRILVIHIICEYQTSSAVMQAFETMLNSLKFLEAAKGAETPE
jgi:hypothetical protein